MIKNLNSKVNLTFLYLIIVALIGVYLRFMFIYDPGILDFRYLLHSHSHTAMLGWVYNALFIALLYTFLPDKCSSKKYNTIFLLTQVSVIGMLISFAAQGYAAVSITFSTAHILMSYAFIYSFIKDTKRTSEISISLRFVYGGLFFLFLSTFGPWGLAIIIASGLGEGDLYKQAIYFYLHFQYNGWFIFTFIGLWIPKIENRLDEIRKKQLISSFNLLFISNIPAYFLSLLGFDMPAVIWIVAALSALFQLYGARKLFRVLFSVESILFDAGVMLIKRLFRFSLFVLLAKFLLQLISSLPEAGTPAYISREVTIAFIHMIMLGVITIGMLGWFGYAGMIKLEGRPVNAGLAAFFIGFITSEILLFYPSLVIWFGAPVIPHYSVLLFISSLLILIGIIALYSSIRKNVDPLSNS